jgi:hypothetical protein
MTDTTVGSFTVSKDLNANQVQGSFRCSCGASLGGGVATVQKGSSRSFTCTQCKKRVTVAVPK